MTDQEIAQRLRDHPHAVADAFGMMAERLRRHLQAMVCVTPDEAVAVKLLRATLVGFDREYAFTLIAMGVTASDTGERQTMITTVGGVVGRIEIPPRAAPR